MHSTVHGENVNRLGPLMDLSDGGTNGGESDAPDWVVVKNASELDNVQLAEQSSDNAGKSRHECAGFIVVSTRQSARVKTGH